MQEANEGLKNYIIKKKSEAGTVRFFQYATKIIFYTFITRPKQLK